MENHLLITVSNFSCYLVTIHLNVITEGGCKRILTYMKGHQERIFCNIILICLIFKLEQSPYNSEQRIPCEATQKSFRSAFLRTLFLLLLRDLSYQT